MKHLLAGIALTLCFPCAALAQEMTAGQIADQIRKVVGNNGAQAQPSRSRSRAIVIENGVDAERAPFDPVPPAAAAGTTAPQPAAAPAGDGCQSVASFYHIGFSRGSDAVAGDGETQRTLAQLAKALVQPDFGKLIFHVRGHTDTTGSDGVNAALSRRRAEKVAQHLAADGVPILRLAAEGMGSKVLADPANPTGAANRRVEVCVTVGG